MSALGAFFGGLPKEIIGKPPWTRTQVCKIERLVFVATLSNVCQEINIGQFNSIPCQENGFPKCFVRMGLGARCTEFGSGDFDNRFLWRSTM